ncbi:MAG TPA: response regulator [Thermoanaerobaculia bacterium]
MAEDSTQMREKLVADIESLGATAVGARSGFEAVKLANEHRPAVVLLDGLLPEMHGFEIARTIRALDPTYRPRIVLITGIYKSRQYQTEAYLKYGIDDYLIKPVKMDSLRDILAHAREPLRP